jgi:hypothetical protein
MNSECFLTEVSDQFFKETTHSLSSYEEESSLLSQCLGVIVKVPPAGDSKT